MKLQNLAKVIAKRAGRRSQARVQEIQEILKIVIEMQLQNAGNLSGGPLDVLSEVVAAKSATWDCRKYPKKEC